MAAPGGPSRPVDLSSLLRTHELHVACKSCCRQKAEITFCLAANPHQCRRNILLVRTIGQDRWRPVNPLPGFLPRPMKYEQCWHFVEGSGCRSHGRHCSFARSSEEAAVWNFLKYWTIELSELIKRLDGVPKHSPKPEDCAGGTDTILRQYPGYFLELCETCLHNTPQRISECQYGNSSKRTPCCTSEHPWKPILVFSQRSQEKNVEFHEIRPRPNKPYSQWHYCKYVMGGQTCWHGRRRCWFAHSAVEMAVWTEESKGPFDRSRLLTRKDTQASQRPRANSMPPGSEKSGKHEVHYCKVCRHKFRSEENYMNHCFTSEHRRHIFEDELMEPKYREPPQTYHSFQMCPRAGTCEHGDRCMQAHSAEELQEWRRRAKAARRKAKVAEEQELLSYQDRLLEEYRSSSQPHHIEFEEVLKQLAGKREHEKQVLVKAQQGNNSFSRKTEEKLNTKMEQIKENRNAHLNALKQRLRQKELHAAEVRKNKEQNSDLSG